MDEHHRHSREGHGAYAVCWSKHCRPSRLAQAQLSRRARRRLKLALERALREDE